MIAGITLLLSASLPTADAAPNLIKCGATITGAAVLTADLVCPSGHGLVVVGNGAVLDCAGHRITGGDRTGQYRMTVRTEGGRPSVAYELMSASRNVIADSQVTAPAGYDIRATASSTGNVFARFSVLSTLDCSVDTSSSVRVTNGHGAALAAGSRRAQPSPHHS